MSLSKWIVFFLIACGITATAQAGNVVPRTIYAIYSAKTEGDPRYTRIHQYAEMPLNHRGFVLKYVEADGELPEITDDVVGAVMWLPVGVELKDPVKNWVWFDNLLNSGRKVLIFGNTGLSEKFRESPRNLEQINHVLNKIGVHDTDIWVSATYKSKVVYKDPELMEFERSFDGGLPGYIHTYKVGDDSVSHFSVLSLKEYATPADLVVTSPRGGYVSDGYGFFEMYTKDDEVLLKQWLLNPFRLFELVFDHEDDPKADTTTLNGRRIFYSHIDGDGWNNLYEGVDKKLKGGRISADVLYDEVYTKYDLYFTVAPIVAELDINCYGVPGSLEAAKRILALPNVEPGSHSWSHPLYWGFFAEGDANSKEKPYLDKYPPKPYERFFLSDAIGTHESENSDFDYKGAKRRKLHGHDHDPLRGLHNPFINEKAAMRNYDTPRSYACENFDLEKEIAGSINFIEKLSGKEVKLFQWSGNTAPFEDAIRLAREAGAMNINGGDSRFDNEYPSYANVAPIAVQIGNERQIYSSNSNENTYTDLWTDRFFGFRYLKETVDNTNLPLRLDPFNVYFHSYSGQKVASLNAVKENLDYALRTETIPIFTSEFTAIANDFFNVSFETIGPDSWKVLNRGTLNTIRFEQGVLKSVDFERSKGVIGQKRVNGSLYVALDPVATDTVITLSRRHQLGSDISATVPYVIDSNWRLQDVVNSKNQLTLKADGIGPGVINLYLPVTEQLDIKVNNSLDSNNKVKIVKKSKQVVRVELPESEKALDVTVGYNGLGE